MEWILNWVKKIFAICIFTGILMHLVPQDKYQQYIRFACSVILTLTCIGPVVSLINGDYNVDKALKNIEQMLEQEEKKSIMELDFLENSDKNQSVYESAVVSYIESKTLEHGLYPTKTEVVIDFDVNSKTYGLLQKITINVTDNKILNKTTDNAQKGDWLSENNDIFATGEKYAELKRELAGYYNINESNVNIYGGR